MLRRLACTAVLLGAALISPLPRATTHAASLTTVSIDLNWIKNVEFAGIWAAQAQGLWAQAGIKVNVDASNGTDPAVLVGAGKYQFGFDDGASLIIARASTVPVKAIWASGETSPFCFITMPKSGITTPKDFKGKVIGYQPWEEFVMDAMLASAGLTEKDVKPQVVNTGVKELLDGKVDAYLAYSTNEPIEIAQQYHVNVNIIPAAKYGYNFYSDVLFTTDSLIKSNPALVQKVVSIIAQGWSYAIAHPDWIAGVVVPKLDNTDSVAQQAAEMRALAQLANAPGAPTGSMTAAKWQAGSALLLKYKQIKTSVKAADMFTTQFLPK